MGIKPHFQTHFDFNTIFHIIFYFQIVMVESLIPKNCTCSHSMNKVYTAIYITIYLSFCSYILSVCFIHPSSIRLQHLQLFVLCISGSRLIIISQSNNCIPSLCTDSFSFRGNDERQVSRPAHAKVFSLHYRRGTSASGIWELIQEQDTCPIPSAETKRNPISLI